MNGHLVRFTYESWKVITHPPHKPCGLLNPLLCSLDLEIMRLKDGRMQVQGLYQGDIDDKTFQRVSS